MKASVEELSVTYDSNPRKHIWTYAIGSTETAQNVGNCPCATGPGSDSPSYVGDNYYCESASLGAANSSTYCFNYPLWDGAGCPEGNNCCDNTTQSWFHRQLSRLHKMILKHEYVHVVNSHLP